MTGIAVKQHGWTDSPGPEFQSRRKDRLIPDPLKSGCWVPNHTPFLTHSNGRATQTKEHVIQTPTFTKNTNKKQQLKHDINEQPANYEKQTISASLLIGGLDLVVHRCFGGGKPHGLEFQEPGLQFPPPIVSFQLAVWIGGLAEEIGGNRTNCS